MTTSVTSPTDPTSAATLASLLGGSGTSSVTSDTSAALNEQDFLKLMTTQLQDQDPLNPTSNSEFFSQIAQFSTVSGISQLNTSFSSLASQLTSTQATQAASMIGHSVLVSGSTAALGSSGISGAVEAASSGDVVLQVRDASGSLVRSIDLGQQSAGRVPFTWDGKDATGNALPSGGTYSLSAQVTNGGTSVAATTDITAQVASVSVGSSGLTLNLQSGGTVPFSSVLQLY